MARPIWVLPVFLSAIFAVLRAETPSADDRLYLASFDLLFRHVAESQQPPTVQRPATPAEARQNLQRDYDIDEDSVATLVAHAVSYTDAVARIDAVAAGIIQAAKKRYRVASPDPGRAVAVPPAPKELVDLQADKDALIRSTLLSIENAIGPAQVRYIAYRLMSHVSVRSVSGK